MVFESENDRQAMLKACGGPARLSDSVGPHWEILGIFERKFVENSRVAGFQPTLFVSELDTWQRDHTWEASFRAVTAEVDHLGEDGVDFKIVDYQPDGTGMVLLILELD